MKYFVKDLSKKFNMKEFVIRFYDSEGLIKNFKRDENGYRYLLEEDIWNIDIINCLRQTNMSLKDIKKYLDLVEKGDDTIEERLQMILEQEKVILKKQQDLVSQINFIERKKLYYLDLIENKKIKK